MTRLNRAALAELTASDSLVLPSDAAPARTGIVHLGIGAFHRAHQAIFTDDAMRHTNDDSWGISGVTQRSTTVRDQLAPQDCLYGVLEKTVDSARVRITGAVNEVLAPSKQAAELALRLADPGVRIITLTVTEKGYRRAADGSLDTNHPDVRHDIETTEAPRSAIGRLVRGLQGRMRASGAPVTVLCCDNLPSNGRVLAGLVTDFCRALPADEGDELYGWLDKNVAFPSTMVDRIVPATTDDDRAEAARITGLDDQGLVVAEQFRQWVIEDSFAAERPAWHEVGAEFTDDVEPYERMKLRILNGTHSTLAYLGALAGYETIAETVRDEALREVASGLINHDVIPTLEAAGDTDFERYGRTVLERFSNPGLRHRTVQIAMDGSEKLPQRLLGTVRDRLAAGASAPFATRGIAGWMAYLASERAASGLDLPIDDPRADRLGQVRGMTDAGNIVDNLLTVDDVFGSDLPANDAWRADLTEAVADVMTTQKAGTR